MKRIAVLWLFLGLSVSWPLTAADVPRPPGEDTGASSTASMDTGVDSRLGTLLAKEDPSDLSASRLWRLFIENVRSTRDEAVFLTHPRFVALGNARHDFFEKMALERPRQFLRISATVDTGLEWQSFVDEISQLEEHLLRRASSLSLREQLGLYLGGRTRIDNLSRRQREALSRERRVDRFLSDPSLVHLPAIQDRWLRGLAAQHLQSGLLYVNVREFIQCKVFLARNLFFRNQPVNEVSVQREYSRILELRREYSDLELFARRNVLYAVSGQRLRGSNRFVFGQTRTVLRLEEQGADVLFLRDSHDTDGSQSLRVLQDRMQDLPRLTFLFEGHGRASALKYADGLSAKDIAHQMMTRSAREKGISSSILMAVTCEGHNLVRSVLSRLHDRSPDVPKPVVIVPEEYGQPFVKTVADDPFLSQDLRLSNDSTTTLGTLMETPRLTTSVYVPDKDNIPAQIL